MAVVRGMADRRSRQAALGMGQDVFRSQTAGTRESTSGNLARREKMEDQGGG
jgi:hypothetical protein